MSSSSKCLYSNDNCTSSPWFANFAMVSTATFRAYQSSSLRRSLHAASVFESPLGTSLPKPSRRLRCLCNSWGLMFVASDRTTKNHREHIGASEGILDKHATTGRLGRDEDCSGATGLECVHCSGTPAAKWISRHGVTARPIGVLAPKGEVVATITLTTASLPRSAVLPTEQSLHCTGARMRSPARMRTVESARGIILASQNC
mmetsp:Transcript_117970/g.328734  ORF Transcript_117970/g.328734 Transcript_117970/m.328734 type:complete len:203 (+) Transcript_117970:447-1055(+)